MSQETARRRKLCPKCREAYFGALSHCPRDGSELTQPPAAAGERVVAGKYRLGKKLGEGAMGCVYAAEQLSVGRQVAVKLLQRHLSLDPQVVRRFRREAKTASLIDDPRTVTIHDFGEEDGELYLVMEFVDGETLHDRLAQSSLPPSEAIHIATEICGALESAHTAGVVHRDLKPDNIMIVAGGIRILDFGIARVDANEAGPEQSHLTMAGALLGTPLYMSPEAAARKRVGPPGDVYALGIILFELLTGAPPFDDDEMVLVLGMHLKAHPPSLSEATGRDFPRDIEDLVRDLLAKDPSTRPSAATALKRLEAVRHLAADLELAGARVPPEGQAEQRKRTEGRGWIWPAVVTTSLTAAAAVSVALTFAGSSTDATTSQPTMTEAPLSMSDDPTVPSPVPAAQETLDERASGERSIQINLRGVPDKAQVRVNGTAMPTPLLALPARDLPYEIEVTQTGHIPWRRAHPGDEDGSYEVRLESRPRRARPAAARTPEPPAIAEATPEAARGPEPAPRGAREQQTPSANPYQSARPPRPAIQPGELSSDPGF